MQIKQDLLEQSSILKEDIIAKNTSLISNYSEIIIHLDNELQSWRVKTSLELKKSYPFLEEEASYSDWTKSVEKSLDYANLEKGINEYNKFRQKAQLPDESEYWQKQLIVDKKGKNSKKTQEQHLKTTIELLSDKWQKALDLAQYQWEIEQINTYRALFMRHFASFLEWLKQIQEMLDKLGFDLGILFDFSRGQLTETDIAQFKRWAKYLSEQKSVHDLCELLGKLREIDIFERLETVTIQQETQREVPVPFYREEITGVKYEKNIAYALPSELALLTDPDTSLLFDLKFIESRLMCFDMVGMQNLTETKSIETEQSFTKQEKLGPMIICVDTSGSMQGAPENIAKAVALYLATKAREMQRACYLINFSTQISTIDLSANMGMKALIQFLTMSFHGGTDATPALLHSIEKLKTNQYENADVLVISDFIMAELSKEIHHSIAERKLNGNKFYSLVIGNCFMHTRLKNIFDQEWIFNPATNNLEEIVRFNNQLSPKKSQ